ncbi:MAG TPA: helix-turn-helix transcriptional regulator [Solirubrobacterales bacterium]|nr:helix-turn-helix transcriptional regulator [Solirubrobacterales bacterium]
MDGRRVDRAAAERLGQNVLMARRRAGFSQEELGAMASLHRTEIGFVESGQRLPRVDTLIKLASALGVGAAELLDGVEWIIPAPTRPGSFAVAPHRPEGSAIHAS